MHIQALRVSSDLTQVNTARRRSAPMGIKVVAITFAITGLAVTPEYSTGGSPKLLWIFYARYLRQVLSGICRL